MSKTAEEGCDSYQLCFLFWYFFALLFLSVSFFNFNSSDGWFKIREQILCRKSCDANTAAQRKKKARAQA